VPRPIDDERTASQGGRPVLFRAAAAPWWIRAGLWFGAPTVAAGYLMWVMVQTISAGQDRIMLNQTTIIENQQLIITTISTQQTALSANAVQLGRIEMVLTRICVNAAKTADERNACIVR
jgi:hypothetical protein